MSSYNMSQIRRFAVDSINEIMPLDDESINEMVQYAIRNYKTREQISNHFLDLLGPTDATFRFVSKFGDMLFGSQQPLTKSELKPALSLVATATKASIPTKPVLGSKEKPAAKAKPAGIRLVKNKVVTNSSSKGRLSSNSKNGATTSDMFNMKPSSIETQKIKKKEIKKKLDSIQDLDGVLLELELMDSKECPDDIRVCNCNATRHPLFEMYPNCLNCGKIICAKEGLQPCSFCGKSLMSDEEKMELTDILNREKEELEGKNEKPKETSSAGRGKKKNVIKITLNTPGQNNFKIQEKFYKQIEENRKQEREQEKATKEEEKEIDQNRREMEYYKAVHKKDPELIKAEERLATLLSFQDNSAERTKIIDNAADFELPTRGSLWASSMERALQLKRQQKRHKQMEEDDLHRSGRGNTVVDMSVRNGKVVLNDRAHESGIFENVSDDEEIQELQQKINKEKQKQSKLEAQNVYDCDSFNEKLFKPVYNGNPAASGGHGAGEDHSAKDMVSELPPLGNVVQLGDVEQQENRLFSMVGV